MTSNIYLHIDDTLIDLSTPMIHFYEPKYQVEGIHELWNTLSNFWFILVGLQLLRRGSPVALPLIIVGICSGMFHASGTLFWEAMDEMSILVLVHVILMNTGDPRLRCDLWVTVPFLCYGLAIYFRKFWIFYLILSFPTLMAVFILREEAIRYDKYRMFNDMITCFTIGKFFWYLEQLPTIRPDHGYEYFWFGHSLWHFFAALAIGHAGLIIDLSRPTGISKAGKTKNE